MLSVYNVWAVQVYYVLQPMRSSSGPNFVYKHYLVAFKSELFTVSVLNVSIDMLNYTYRSARNSSTADMWHNYVTRILAEPNNCKFSLTKQYHEYFVDLELEKVMETTFSHFVLLWYNWRV